MKERHELLLGAIGVFKEEEDAYQLATKFTWILPVVILCGGLVDLALIVVYMKFAHPWKVILYKEKVSKTNMELNEVVQDEDEIIVCNTETNSLEEKANLDDDNQYQVNSSLDEIRYNTVSVHQFWYKGPT